LQFGKSLFERADGGPEIVPTCCQRYGKDGIAWLRWVRYSSPLLFSDNIAIKEFGGAIELGYRDFDLSCLPRGKAVRIKMTPVFHLRPPK
jgi:predicted outer membrane repeat protein